MCVCMSVCVCMCVCIRQSRARTGMIHSKALIVVTFSGGEIMVTLLPCLRNSLIFHNENLLFYNKNCSLKF